MPDRSLVPMVLWISLAICGAARPMFPAGAQLGGKTQPPAGASQPEPVEDAQEVSAVEPGASPAGTAMIGRMHPALIHFPIAWVVLLALLESAALLTGRDELSRVRLVLLVLACLSFIPAAATGFLLAASKGDYPEFQALMVPHRNLNLAAGAACLAALAVCAGQRGRFGNKARWPYLLLLGCAAAMLLVAGHLGGKMVFGADYLPF